MRNVVIASPIQTQSGYGYHAREFVKNILEQTQSEWNVKLLSMPWGMTPFSYPVPEEWKSKFTKIPIQSNPDIWIQITVPNEFQRVGRYNIGVTAGTEGTVCPPEWIDKINEFNLIIVPSEFTKQTFYETAKQTNKTITTTIRVVPEYFDEEYFDRSKPLIEIDGIDDIKEDFAFLFVGHWLQGQLGQDRKDISGMIHTFFNTYKDTKNAPALIIKTGGATYSITDRFDIDNKVEQIKEIFAAHELPNIYLLHGELSDDEMNSLYNHKKVKAMISFTKGEGFGRPLLEFATTGKPILAPHYSGQADFLKKEFICALPGRLTPIHQSAQNPFLIKEASWFTVDYKYAGNMMKEVQKNYKKWLELGKRQRFFAISNFSSTAVKEHYKSLVEFVTEQTKSIPVTQELKLPKLQKIGEKKETPKVQLPKLQKV